VLKELREFAVKGNVIDLAVGVVLAGAFGKIVSSLVDDIIMPPLGLLLKNVDFQNLFLSLSEKHPATLAQAKADGVPTINYGIFITTIVNFAIVALAMFFLVRGITRVQKQLYAEKAAEASKPPA